MQSAEGACARLCMHAFSPEPSSCRHLFRALVTYKGRLEGRAHLFMIGTELRSTMLTVSPSMHGTLSTLLRSLAYILF